LIVLKKIKTLHNAILTLITDNKSRSKADRTSLITSATDLLDYFGIALLLSKSHINLNQLNNTRTQ